MTPADILALRLRLNLSQEQFAGRLRPPVCSTTVSRWERGVTSPQYRETQALRRMARRVERKERA